MKKVISKDPKDFGIPGVLIEVTAADIELMGITPELAMSQADAMEANGSFVGKVGKKQRLLSN